MVRRSVSVFRLISAGSFDLRAISNDVVEEGFLWEGLDDTCRAWQVSDAMHLVPRKLLTITLNSNDSDCLTCIVAVPYQTSRLTTNSPKSLGA